jgi:hypothetical protein
MMTAMQVMRIIGLAVEEFKKLIPRLWGIARELFHEVIGFIFMAVSLFFVFGSGGLIRTIKDLDSDPDSVGRLLLVSAAVLMFGGFGLSSFVRARRISRERQ